MSPGSKREPRNISDVDPDSFGAQLRRYRMDAGLSQEELGEAIGADQARISRFERGINVPNEDVIVSLAEVLKIAPSILLEAGHFRGVLAIGAERRERLRQLHEPEWLLFDQVLDTLGEVSPGERAQFEQGFHKFLTDWKEFQKD